MLNTFNSSLLSIKKIKKTPPFHSSIQGPRQPSHSYYLQLLNVLHVIFQPKSTTRDPSFLSIYQSLHSDGVPKQSQSCKKNDFPVKRVLIILGPPLTSLPYESISWFSVLVRQSTSFNTKYTQCELIANGILNIMKN